MANPAAELLADLYIAAGQDEHQRQFLNELVERAGFGWRCEALLAADEGVPCEYLNVPMLVGRDYVTSGRVFGVPVYVSRIVPEGKIFGFSSPDGESPDARRQSPRPLVTQPRRPLASALALQPRDAGAGSRDRRRFRRSA